MKKIVLCLGVFITLSFGATKEQILSYEKMANQGNIEAQKNLGYIYLEKENYEKAFYWYKKASDQGDFGAELIIKKMYANGFIK
jgi:hypothetical protein